VRGHVWPATTNNVQLKAAMDDDNIIIGESAITKDKRKIKHLMLEPENPAASQKAVNAILNADAIILGPGSLYTSVLASLIVPGIKDAVIRPRQLRFMFVML